MAGHVKEGQVLAGKYRVERVLGTGGMGVVVAARHLELGELRAIKYMVPSAHGPDESAARFMREARAAARLRSKHALKVHDVGRFESGEPYMVMEYLDGRDLKQELKERGALPITQAVDWVLQACEALGEAHALGIIHRDLKPSNLFVTDEQDGDPYIKVLDFGISKLIGGEHDSDDLTQTAEVLGTPAYMSPEQMAEARDIDVRADIWSLGVILYELLSGTRPFAGRSVPAITMAVTGGPPPSLRARRPDAPVGLEQVVLQCLSRDRDVRFYDIHSLAIALAPFASPRARDIVDRIGRFVRTSFPESPASRRSFPTPIPVSSPTAASWGADASPMLTSRARRARVVAVIGAMLAIAGVGTAVALDSAEAAATVESWSGHCERVASEIVVPSTTIDIDEAAPPPPVESAKPATKPITAAPRPPPPRPAPAPPPTPSAKPSGPRSDPFGETWH